MADAAESVAAPSSLEARASRVRLHAKPLAGHARRLARRACAVVHNPEAVICGPIAAVRRIGPSPLWEDPTVASVEERVIEIVCENLGVNKEQVTRNTSFIEDIGADSLDIVELVMELEEEFEITIPDEQAEKIKTVGEAIDYIERELSQEMTRRVVITGMGTVNPLASDVPAYWQALLRRQERHRRRSSSSTPPPSRSTSAARSRTSTPRRCSTRKTARRLDRFAQFALVAAHPRGQGQRPRLRQGRSLSAAASSSAAASAA